MLREHFWKPFTPQGADGRWVYELILQERGEHPGLDLIVVRHFFGFDGLGHDVEELSCDHFTNIDDANQNYNSKKLELTKNGFTESSEVEWSR